MEHIAIDLGGRESQICVRDQSGQIIEEKRVFTVLLGEFLRRPAARIVLETCSEAFSVADSARELGHDVRIVPATMVRALGVGSSGIKTDRRDARILSEVSSRISLPSVYLPSQQARERKALCNSREVLVQSRTKLINHCRGFLRTQAQRIRSGDSTTFVARIREHDRKLPDHIERVLGVLELLSSQIHELDKQLASLAKDDELCARLMSVPGVGPVTAVRFAAAVGEAERFAGSHAVQAYFGLVPGEHSSGDRKHRTSLTKAGSTRVRWVLMQAAWSAYIHRRNDPMVCWARQVEQRRGRHIAIVALARKMAGILFAIWRDGTRYNASLGAQRIDADGVVHPVR